ncbi:hypothetical protein Ahy_B08g093212 [Arachis hypogaea]|uniref:Glycosyltransferase n=1 Tax=Arachis hypogaea TaxID=3818 RepID=A0A444Y5I9_ARAHY|nr:hypothetical protein Ahy_B08g093212 [Arachis hypogaea]
MNSKLMTEASSLHLAMYPWLAMGHLTPFLHLSNKLANRDHRISFFIPKRTISKLQHLNLHPHLITFIPITVPHVHGLPYEAETTADVSPSSITHLATAIDLTHNDIELLLKDLKPQIVIFDFQHWLPNIARNHGIKCIQYAIVNPATVAYFASPARLHQGRNITELDLKKPPSPDFPDASSIDLRAHELRNMVAVSKREFGSGVLFFDRLGTGFLFLAAIKTPAGFNSMEEVLPEGFKERNKEKSVVHGGWVPQQLLLGHPNVGCFITHCGGSSVTEALVNECQIVLLPGPYSDHVINARILGRKMKVRVEVEKGKEDGLFSKESVCKAVKIVMDDGNEVGREIRDNHTKVRNLLLAPNFESSCLDDFILRLQDML